MWLLILRGYSYYMCSINKNNESEKTPYRFLNLKVFLVGKNQMFLKLRNKIIKNNKILEIKFQKW